MCFYGKQVRMSGHGKHDNSLAIRQEIQRFESVHPSIYAIYDLIDLVSDTHVAKQIREHVVAIEGLIIYLFLIIIYLRALSVCVCVCKVYKNERLVFCCLFYQHWQLWVSSSNKSTLADKLIKKKHRENFISFFLHLLFFFITSCKVQLLNFSFTCN